MACLSCGRGLIGECNCESGSQVERASAPQNLMEALSSYQPESGGDKNKPGRPHKENEEVTDPKSTGRKRAATLYPLDRRAFCEWRDLANCGGGKNPIVGCATGYQENLHHGPDKDTLNNTRSEDTIVNRNVHKICTKCHNRWHAANDNDYDPSIPHNPREANLAERISRISQELDPRKVK
jgi:hypothetical protein